MKIRSLTFLIILPIFCVGQTIWTSKLNAINNSPWDWDVTEIFELNESFFIGQRYNAPQLDKMKIYKVNSFGQICDSISSTTFFPTPLANVSGLFVYPKNNIEVCVLRISKDYDSTYLEWAILDTTFSSIQYKNMAIYGSHGGSWLYSDFEQSDFILLTGYSDHPINFHVTSCLKVDTTTKQIAENAYVQSNGLAGYGFGVQLNKWTSQIHVISGNERRHHLILDQELDLAHVFDPFSTGRFNSSSIHFEENRWLIGGFHWNYFTGSNPEVSRAGFIVTDSVGTLIDSFFFEGMPTYEKHLGVLAYHNDSNAFLATNINLGSRHSQHVQRWLGLYNVRIDGTINWQRILGPFDGYYMLQNLATSDGGCLIVARYHNGNRWMYELMKVDKYGNYVGKDEYAKHHSDVTVFPNPATTNLNIELTGFNDALNVRLLDMNGKVILKNAYESGSNLPPIHIEALPKGIYILDLRNENNQIIHRSVISKQ